MCVLVYVCVNLCVCEHVCVHMCVSVCVCLCMHVCMYQILPNPIAFTPRIFLLCLMFQQRSNRQQTPISALSEEGMWPGLELAGRNITHVPITSPPASCRHRQGLAGSIKALEGADSWPAI